MKTLRSALLYAALTTSTLAYAPASFATDLGPKIKLGHGQTLTGRFVHEHPVQGFDEPMRTEGKFAVSPNSKITWAIEKPMMTTTVITNEGLTQSVGNFALLRMTPQQMPFLAELQKNLIWALSGDWAKLKKDFVIAQKGTPQAWEVTITPKDNPAKPKPFQKLVAHGAEYVDRAEVVLPNGTVDRVSFSNAAITSP